MELLGKTVRLQENTYNTLKKQFHNFSTACNLILEPFEKLRTLTMKELRQKFTREELTALVDSQNGTLFTPDYLHNKHFLIYQLNDFESLEKGISRHGAEPAPLLEKIKELSHAEIYFLLMDIKIFWNTGEELEKYL